jgi:hypothetical protein
VTPSGGSALTDDELARAAELEARIVADERAAEEALRRQRERERTGEDMPTARRTRTTGGLAVQYAHEYDYVARDLRRIAFLSTGLIGTLVLLFVISLVSGGSGAS